jgi:hypothetical protein
VPFNYFYTQFSSVFDENLMMYRQQGGIPMQNQFFPGNLKRRFDALTFIQTGTPLHFMQDKLKELIESKSINNK